MILHVFTIYVDDSTLLIVGFSNKMAIVVLAGDFNSFPSDMFIGKLLNTGLEDGAIVNRNPYDYTFLPLGGGGFARIDYTLVSKHLSMQYQENFEIPGSDHRGVMVWIDFFN